MADPERLPGGWLPPRPPGRPSPEPPRPGPPVAPSPPGGGTSGLAVAAMACAIGSLALLVLTLGLSFAFSLPLAVIAWVCAVRARRGVEPGRHGAALVLAISAVALSVVATAVWLA